MRNHAPVPSNLETESHEIHFSREVRADDEVPIACLSLPDILKKYEKINVISVLQCAGNRASESIKNLGISGFNGTPFEKIQIGMVGNVSWSGISLKDVLEDHYPNACEEEKRSVSDRYHVIFEGADEYETSTPLSYILKENKCCVLATQMNGEELTVDHGYPVRVILPGVAGARSVKWLQSIKISKEPSKSPWNSHYYKHRNGSHIQELPLNSIILSPQNGDFIEKENETVLKLEGVAYSGGSGNSIQSVELSVDEGQTWV